jgi:hypothetical protein
MSHTHHAFFHSRQQLLFAFSSLYVLGLILSHATLPPVHVWIIAAFFSVAMNFTYMIEAAYVGRWLRFEVVIAATLITASILGVLIHPLFAIAAIFAHGLWDIAKHRGAGVPFVSWYTLGCFVVDVTYSTVLLIYWVQTG